MSTTRRFLFETSFDEGFRPFEAMPVPEPMPTRPEPEPEPEPEPVDLPPPEPTYSKEELLRAHEDGYADGFAAGKAAAESSAASRAAASLGMIEALLDRLVAPLEDEAAERRRAATEIGLAVARKLLPHAARRHALGEIEGVIAAAVSEMIDEPRLVIRIADAMLDEVGERLDALTTARGFNGRVVLLADPSLAPGDCRVEWAEGGVERSAERVWHDVDRAAARVAPPSRAEAARPSVPVGAEDALAPS